MITLAEAKAIYRTGKGHFFDRETFKYWGSRIESALYKNRCFVTSENNFDSSRRAYTVRRFSPDFLHVETGRRVPGTRYKMGRKRSSKGGCIEL